jgi:transcriptional regulator with XRE-family HTH domain
MTIVEKIKAIREAKRMTQTEIANSIGVERSYYSRLENHLGNRVYFDVIQSICKAIGITVLELLEYGEPKDVSNGHPLADQALVKELEKLRGEYIKLSNAYMKSKHESALQLLFIAPVSVILTEIAKAEAINEREMKEREVNNFIDGFLSTYLKAEGFNQDISSPMIAEFLTPEEAKNHVAQRLPALIKDAIAKQRASKQKQ